MLTDTKDILNLVISTSAALLGPALTILALVPIIIQVISEKVRSHFAAARERRRLRTALALLSGLSLALLINVVLIGISALVPSLQADVAVLTTIILLGSVVAFVAAFGLGIHIIWKTADL